MAEALKLGVCDLFPKLAAHTEVILGFLESAWAIALFCEETFPNACSGFGIGVDENSHHAAAFPQDKSLHILTHPPTNVKDFGVLGLSCPFFRILRTNFRNSTRTVLISERVRIQKGGELHLHPQSVEKSMGEPLDRVPPCPLLIFGKEGVFRALRSAT